MDLSLDRIAEASRTVDPVFLRTPQYADALLDAALGRHVVVKVETANPLRSFKGRGADFLMSQLTPGPTVVCSSTGNFGQGMAYSARKRGLTLTIFASVTANPLKVERMRALGADVRLTGDDFDAAHFAAAAFAAETGAQLIEDGRDAPIAEGAGTIGLELLRWPEPFDAILVPLGDGALLAGVARWVKAYQRGTQMIGVCASGAPAMERSWRAAQVQELESANTIADGIAVRSPFPEALSDLLGLVDDILLVDDDALVTAMRLAHRESGVVLEPAGAAALAALLTNRPRFGGHLIGTILTGGNLTMEQIERWL